MDRKSKLTTKNKTQQKETNTKYAAEATTTNYAEIFKIREEAGLGVLDCFGAIGEKSVT